MRTSLIYLIELEFLSFYGQWLILVKIDSKI